MADSNLIYVTDCTEWLFSTPPGKFGGSVPQLQCSGTVHVHKPVFFFRQNGRANVFREGNWRCRCRRGYIPHSVDVINPFCCFPFSFPPTRFYAPSHSNVCLPWQGCYGFLRNSSQFLMNNHPTIDSV